jgi:hypothetical protein
VEVPADFNATAFLSFYISMKAKAGILFFWKHFKTKHLSFNISEVLSESHVTEQYRQRFGIMIDNTAPLQKFK